MQSKNKEAQTVAERKHVARVKELPCAVCEAPGPSEAHELEQGLWWLTVPLCASCHRGEMLGLHGQRRMWAIKKKTELSVLNDTIKALV